MCAKEIKHIIVVLSYYWVKDPFNLIYLINNNRAVPQTFQNQHLPNAEITKIPDLYERNCLKKDFFRMIGFLIVFLTHRPLVFNH